VDIFGKSAMALLYQLTLHGDFWTIILEEILLQYSAEQEVVVLEASTECGLHQKLTGMRMNELMEMSQDREA